jgi:Trk K+ transport system NAD-binding subunit
MEQPIVVCGLGRVGSRVLQYLQATGLPVVIVDTLCKPDDPRLQGTRVVCGDCRKREVLEAAGIDQARGVLIVTGDDLVNVAATLMVRALNPDVRVVLRMFNQNLMGRLGKTVKNVYALSTSLLTAPILAMTALTGQGLGRFHLEGGVGEERRHVAELTITPGSEFAGKRLADLTRGREVQVLAHLPVQGEPRFLMDLATQAPLQAGDHVVVCGEPTVVSNLLTVSGQAEQADLLWAGMLRRFARVFGRTFSEVDPAVKICAGVFLVVVLCSTVVLHFGVPYPTARALFRTISIIATGADMHEEDYMDNEPIKVFVSLLRILGTLLLAAFTAIVTNYLIRTRLAGALEVRRIPDQGHVVIVGLSPVGFRTLEELLDCGVQVVVIEKDADNRFVVTGRRKGAAVIVGDATVLEVLRQAHVGTSRAVIVATNHDLVNLEVALLARELNPDQRVVLLQSDPQLAQMLREAANVQLAVSVPALAAPAFLAGLFGDRVLSVFLVGGRLLAVIDLVIHEEDTMLNGQPLRAVAIDYHIQPLAVLPPPGTPAGSQPLNTRLLPGCRLIGIIALPDLEHLLRRQPSTRHYAVEVTGFPLPTRGWLTDLLRTLHKVSAEEASGKLDQLPVQIESNLTRGQAEDLLARLQRERISASVRDMQAAAAK